MGKCLYRSGRIPASRLALLSALKVNGQKQTEIHQLLAEAYLRDANPQLDKALEQNTLFQQCLAKDRLYLVNPKLLRAASNQ